LTGAADALKPVRRVRGTVRYVSGHTVLLARGFSLYRSQDSGSNWERIQPLPAPKHHVLAGHVPALRRLLRCEVHHWQPLKNGQHLIIAAGHVYRGTGLNAWRRVSSIVGKRPLALARTPEGGLFYGEYRNNRERSPVSVWASEDEGSTWRRAWTFDRVRHVHGVFHDPWENSMWVTTGDEQDESGLWRTRDSFRTLELVAGRSQEFRVVQPLFLPAAVLFGSDEPGRNNFLYRLERKTGELRRIQPVGGPVFYGVSNGASCFFATVVEPEAANHDGYAHVWASSDEGCSWRKILSFRKDVLPPRLFQYGQVLFPAGPGAEGRIWLTPYATNGDQVSLLYDLPN
jgi:hypothetical protein